MIKKLSGNKKKEINVVEYNKKRENRRSTRARESGIVQRIKRHSRDIEIQSVSQNKEISKSNNDSLDS